MDAADFDGEPAFYFRNDLSLHHLALTRGAADIFPDIDFIRFLLREDEQSSLPILLLQEDIDLIPHFHIQLPVPLQELLHGNLAFTLVANIHSDMIGRNLDDRSPEDLALCDLLKALLIERLKVFCFFPAREFLRPLFLFSFSRRRLF